MLSASILAAIAIRISDCFDDVTDWKFQSRHHHLICINELNILVSSPLPFSLTQRSRKEMFI